MRKWFINTAFEGDLPGNEKQVPWAAMFGRMMNVSTMAHSYKNHFFHNIMSCNNIQGTDSYLAMKQRKRKSFQFWCLCCCCSYIWWMCLSGETALVHLWWQCLPINHLPQMCVSDCVCVCDFSFFFVRMDEVHVWLWQVINQPLCSSPFGKQNTHRYNLTRTFWHALLNFKTINNLLSSLKLRTLVHAAKVYQGCHGDENIPTKCVEGVPSDCHGNRVIDGWDIIKVILRFARLVFPAACVRNYRDKQGSNVFNWERKELGALQV